MKPKDKLTANLTDIYWEINELINKNRYLPLLIYNNNW